MTSASPERRALHNRWYYERGGQAKVAAARVAARRRNIEYVRESKAGKPCLDCGREYPFYVMEYDHIGDDKDKAIGTLANRPVSIARLQAEIDKCELVCANCHRERTWQRSRAPLAQSDRATDS